MLEIVEESGRGRSAGCELRGGESERRSDVWVRVCGGWVDAVADELDELEPEEGKVQGSVGIEDLGVEGFSMQFSRAFLGAHSIAFLEVGHTED